VLVVKVDMIGLESLEGRCNLLSDKFSVSTDTPIRAEAELGGKEYLVTVSGAFEPFSNQLFAVSIYRS